MSYRRLTITKKKVTYGRINKKGMQREICTEGGMLCFGFLVLHVFVSRHQLFSFLNLNMEKSL